MPPLIAVALVGPVAGPMEASGEWDTVLRHSSFCYTTEQNNIFRQIFIYLACMAVVPRPAVADVRLGADSPALLASLRTLRVSAVIVRILGQSRI